MYMHMYNRWIKDYMLISCPYLPVTLSENLSEFLHWLSLTVPLRLWKFLSPSSPSHLDGRVGQLIPHLVSESLNIWYQKLHRKEREMREGDNKNKGDRFSHTNIPIDDDAALKKLLTHLMMYIWGMINIDLLKGSLLLVLLAGQTGLEQNKLPNDKNNVW